MAIKMGPYCEVCAGHKAVTDVAVEGSVCRVCGEPGEILVDPYGECGCEPCVASAVSQAVEYDCWLRGVDPEHFESEDRWLELFGVS